MANNKLGKDGFRGRVNDGAPLKLPTTGTQKQIVREGANIKVPPPPKTKDNGK
jgi:hypothetical protein